jgi:hypothetical protein
MVRRHCERAILVAAWISGLAGCGTSNGSSDPTGSSGDTSSAGGSRTASSTSGASNGSGSHVSSKASGSNATSSVATASNGSASTSGASNASSSGAGSASSSTSATPSASPLGCHFAWGEPLPTGSVSSYSWLQFMTNWAGYEIAADGSINAFQNGSFVQSLASTSIIPAYYSYLIGYYGHANALPDQNCCSCGKNCCVNCTSTQPNLTTGAAYLLLGDPSGANAPCGSTTQFCSKNLVVQAYAYYATQTHAVWSTKPFVWLIEGDFIQYTDASQVASTTSTSGASAGLTYAQLGQLASLIASAIKTNMPNAVVAFDDSPWINDAERTAYWQGIMQAGTQFDMVWTTGVGNNVPYLNAGESSKSSNGTTGTYTWLHQTTGKPILVDESAGASQQSDTWSNQSASTLNKLIADGVVAVNVSDPPSTYQSNITALASQLSSTCP